MIHIYFFDFFQPPPLDLYLFAAAPTASMAKHHTLILPKQHKISKVVGLWQHFSLILYQLFLLNSKNSII